MTTIATAPPPPPIPACRKSQPWDAREHLMMWVHTGRAHVRLPTGVEHRVEAGTGIWLPPGSDHDMWTEPGTVSFPTWVSPHAVSGGPSDVARFTVDAGWRDWLIGHYAHAVTRSYPGIGSQVSPGDLVDVLAPSGPRLPRRAGRVEPGRFPPMPRTPAARTVAHELLRDPALNRTVDEWAAAAACSPSTLRREFLARTDLTFSQWRTLCRLAAGCELLAAGHDISQVAARIGFATRNGFTRAFREHYCMTPSDYAATAADSLNGRPVRRVAADRQGSAPGHGLADASTAPLATHATRSAPSVYADNELSWIYRGEGWSRIGGTTYPRSRGDAIWLPAGQENETALPENSVALPVASLGSEDVRLIEPLRARFPPSWDAYLLYCSVSTNTLLRPEGYDPRHILDVFNDQLAIERAQTVPMPSKPRAREAATQFLRRVGTTAESATFDVPPDIHAEFRSDTGMTFASWRHAARMRIARDLLSGGTGPTIVARRVGYTQASNFSRAFTRFHGISPREHQEQELDAP